MKVRLQSGIRVFALICVAVTSAYVMWLGQKVIATLSGPGWCATAFGAGHVAGTEPIKGLEACVGLLTIQLRSLSTASFILLGTIALCLLVLVVVVIAQARLELRASRDGVDANMAADPPTPVIVANPPEAPVPVEPTAPAMPQPPGVQP